MIILAYHQKALIVLYWYTHVSTFWSKKPHHVSYNMGKQYYSKIGFYLFLPIQNKKQAVLPEKSIGFI